MVEIKINNENVSVKLSGAPVTILSEFTAAIDSVSKTIADETTKGLSKKVKLLIICTLSERLSETAVSLLTDKETATGSRISVDTYDLGELKKQMQEMENGNDN